jgi:hypothetical protein
MQCTEAKIRIHDGHLASSIMVYPCKPYQQHSFPECYQRIVAGRCYHRHHSCLTDEGLPSHLHTIFVGRSPPFCLLSPQLLLPLKWDFGLAVASLPVFKNGLLLTFSLRLLEVEEIRTQ